MQKVKNFILEYSFWAIVAALMFSPIYIKQLLFWLGW